MKKQRTRRKEKVHSSNEQLYIPITPKDDIIYQKNMVALREVYPEYAKALDGVELINYQVVLTGSKQRLNVFSARHNLFYYDQEEPIDDIKSQIDMLNLKNTKIAVFLGFGLGFIADYYSRFVSQTQGTQYMVIIEQDLELFKTAITYIDYSPMIRNPAIKLILGENENNLFYIFEQYFSKSNVVFFLKCIKMVYHASALVLGKDYYLAAVKRLKESVVYRLQFFGNDPHDSIIGVQNMLDNIDEIIGNPGINLLYDEFRGKPAVIASTGPSLNKNKHLLKGLEDRTLILCPEASLPVLLELGVKPHLVTSLERVSEVVTLMTGFSNEEVKDVYYAATPVIPKAAYEAYAGPRIIVYRNFDHFKWLEIERGILDIKHSAGNMAFKLAEALGCDPIILIGQDLAYSRDGKTHATGTTFGELQQLYNDKNYMVMGNDGEPILTNDDWNTFRVAYEVDIAGYQGTCINSTEGGALIDGTVVMPFQEAIDKYITSEFNPLQKIKNCLSVFSLEQVNDEVVKLIAIIDKTISDLEYMSCQCKKGVEAIREYEPELTGILYQEKEDKVNVKELLPELLAYKKNIIETNPTMQLFLMHIVQPYHIKFEIDMNAMWEKYDRESQVLAEIALEHIKWYSVIHDIILICNDSLKKAREKVIAPKD